MTTRLAMPIVVSLLEVIALASVAPAAERTFTVAVSAGTCARLCEPVTVEAPVAGFPVRAELTEKGRHIPAQVWHRPSEGTARVTWIVRDLAAGQKRTHRLRLTKGPPPGESGVRVSPQGDEQLAVDVGGRPFTVYHFGSDLPRPYCFPVLGVRGERVTRAYPMEKDVPGETTDHVHHRSFWVAFGNVNGTDFWAEGPASGRTVHRAFEAVEGGPVFGRIRSLNDWVAPDGEKLMEDVRELRVYDVGPFLRMLDFEITFRATDGPVTLGDTKEGLFALRVASTMDVKPDGTGGRIGNSAGGVNESQTWGKRADWCDYSGPVAGGVSGIAIMDHPANLRHPTWWFVRNYGLLACNPFGERAYTGNDQADGTYLIPAGQELTLRYRVVIHEGDATAGNIKALWESYATPPEVSVKR